MINTSLSTWFFLPAAYLYLIEKDTNFEVRRTVLSCIAPASQTLPAILQRTKDVKDSVRKMAYQVGGHWSVWSEKGKLPIKNKLWCQILEASFCVFQLLILDW